MLHIGTGHSNNRQVTLKLFGYDIFAIICSTKKIEANLEVSEVLITYVTNRGKATVMVHIGAGHSNNNPIFPNSELIRGNLSAKHLAVSTY